MTEDEYDPTDWGSPYPERIAVGYLPKPELPPIVPPRGVLRAIVNKLGVHRMNLEQLKEADLKLTARSEVLARLGQPSSASAEVIRELDRAVDQLARDRSRTWTIPLDSDQTYHARLSSTLSLAALGLNLGQGTGGASVSGWQDVCDSGMFYVQSYRRRDLWGIPLPDFLNPNR